MNKPENKEIKCVWDKLKAMPEIKEILKDFGDYRGFKLKITCDFDMVDSPMGAGEVPEENPDSLTGEMLIVINPELMKAKGIDASHLGIAKTIIHELIHARLYAKIVSAGGLNATKTGMQNSGSIPALEEEMNKYRKADGTIDMASAQHEFMARYNFDELVNALKEYDGNRESLDKYEAVCWEGLLNTQRYGGNTPYSLGYNDPNMDNNRQKKSDNLKNARKLENPCNR